MTKIKIPSKYSTAASRWAGVGPYYAMFPIKFADSVINKYTNPGETILDPFAGRATTLFSAATNDRFAWGSEINPVGWVYGKAKLFAAKRGDVEDTVEKIAQVSNQYEAEIKLLPKFFSKCFTPEVLRFLLAARGTLNWKRKKSDWTTMALLLIDLHGKEGSALSNQMRQTKSMSPEYAIKWWKDNHSKPPHLNVKEFMMKKIAWRYAKGELEVEGGRLHLGDSRAILSRFKRDNNAAKANMLFTSPPYYGVTNYFYDQWLRIWLLGGPSLPYSFESDIKGRFNNGTRYEELLKSVFFRSSEFLSNNATVFVRTDSREFTKKVTLRILKEIFPKKRIRKIIASSPINSQTRLFQNSAKASSEVDIVMY